MALTRSFGAGAEPILKQTPLSSRHAYPSLWPSHFTHFIEASLPVLAARVLAVLHRNPPEPLDDSGLFVPTDDTLERGHRAWLSESIADIIAPHIGTDLAGWDPDLVSLLCAGFQFLEQGYCERYRENRERFPIYQPVKISPDVLGCYFGARCTQDLGPQQQIFWFSESNQTALCRSYLSACSRVGNADSSPDTCAFMAMRGGTKRIAVEPWGSDGHVHVLIQEFVCGETAERPQRLRWTPATSDLPVEEL